MRADRLVSILLLLQVNHRITARELAKRLEVSERTIHRDMEALSMAGVPVVAERGNGGGWSLLEPYKTNLTGLNQAEVQTLFVAKPSRLLSDLGLHEAAEAALIKLLAAIPSTSRRDAEYARQRIHVDVGGWRNTAEDISWLPVLLEAVWQERKVQLLYRRSDRDPAERVVDPLGLVAKGNVWYLAAGVDGEIRTYRVSRIENARLSDQPCTRPPDFDLEAHWRQSSVEFQAKLPRYYASVRVSASVLPWLRYGRWSQRIERADPPDAQGWTAMHIRFDVEEEACQFALSFADQIEVLEPETLREKVIRGAENVTAFYSRKATA